MKDFVKWLGVNDKIAKLIIWIFVIMLFLILTNAMLGSVGLPNYQITYENFKQIKFSNFLDTIINWIYVILNFLGIVLLTFKIENIKTILKYSLLYLIINIIVTYIFNFVIAQVFVIIFVVLFSYFYSGKKYKYILYSVISVAINVCVQAITYFYKAKFMNFNIDNSATQLASFSDYFIIMGIIILVKEIYLKKRSEVK